MATVLNRNMALLLSGQLVSQLGDKIHLLAVAFLVLETTGSPAKMGLVLFCTIFPAMLLGIVAGAVLDRCNKKHLIVAADLIRGLVVGGVGLAYANGMLGFGQLLLAQILVGICSAFFDPAIPAMIPQLVDRANLSKANSQTQLVNGLATVFGPVLGGLTVAWGGYLPVFFINAGSYLLSAAFESRIRLPLSPPTMTPGTDLGSDIRAGCRYVWHRQPLKVILIMVAVIHLFVGTIEAVIPVMAATLRGHGPTNVGYLQTAFGIGTVVAAALISIRRIDGHEARFLFGSVFVMGLLLLAMGGLSLNGAQGAGVFLPLLMALGGALILAGTSFRSLLQKSVMAAMLGRVFGFVSSVGNISIPLAVLISGALMTYWPYPYLLMASGISLLPLSLGALHHYCPSASAAAENRAL